MFIVNQEANTKPRNVRLKLRVSEKNQISCVGQENTQTDRQTLYKWVEEWREWLCLHVWYWACVFMHKFRPRWRHLCLYYILFLPKSTDVSVVEKTERSGDLSKDESKEIVFSRHHRSLAPISSLWLWEHAQCRFKLKPDEIP